MLAYLCRKCYNIKPKKNLTWTGMAKKHPLPLLKPWEQRRIELYETWYRGRMPGFYIALFLYKCL